VKYRDITKRDGNLICQTVESFTAATRSPRSGHRTPWRHYTPLPISTSQRRPDRRDRVTVLHDATIPPCRFQPKYLLESPKSPITQTPITQSFKSRFQILSMHTMAHCLGYSMKFDSSLHRVQTRSYQIVCTPGSPPLTHLFPPFRISALILQRRYYSKTFTRAIVCGVTSALSMGLITPKLSAKCNGNCGPSLWHLPQFLLQCPVMIVRG
jgi:hypothetical protein